MRGWSPFTKTSPAKHTEEPHTEHHELMGTINDAGTRVIDEKGNWTGVGDRPDLASEKQIASAKASAKPPGFYERAEAEE